MEANSFRDANEVEDLRAAEFFREHQFAVYKRTDRIFSILLPLQWLAGIAAAYLISPLTWVGDQSSIHPHLWMAIVVGGLINTLPIYLTIFHPGKTLTRQTVAVTQMLMSGLLIHVSGGRIETHFHIFGSLAFLACYRDWRVLITATVVTATDHFLRGWLYPISMYGIATPDLWRWVEHAGWVIFTDIILIDSCRRNVREMRELGKRAASYASSEERYRAVVEQTTDGIVLLEPETLRIVECNEAFRRIIGCESIDDAKTLDAFDFTTLGRDEVSELSRMMFEQKATVNGERVYRRRDGSGVDVEISANVITFNESYAFCLNVKDITDRKQIEEKNQGLLKDLADFKFALDESAIVVITDYSGKITYVNNKFCEISKYPREELIGQDHRLFNSGHHPKEFISELWSTIGQAKVWRGEIKNLAKDGSAYWVDTTIVPILNTKGNPQQYVAIRYDITERKAAEDAILRMNETLEHRIGERTVELVQANEAMRAEVAERKHAESKLSEAREFLHSVIDNVPNLIFVKDALGKYVLGNQALANARGTTVSELIGKTRADFGGDLAQSQAFTDEDVTLLANFEGQVIQDEMHTDANGEIRYYQTAKRSLVLGKDGARLLIGVCTDITERKRAEVELSESKLFLNAVIDNVPNPIFVKDAAGRFVLANRALADLFGTSTGELIGKTEQDIASDPIEGKRCFEEDISTLENLDEQFIPEYLQKDADGNTHWFQTVKRSVTLGENSDRYLIGVATDLTERKLMEGKLQQSQKLESIGQLAAGIAHEINTPTQYVGDNTRFIRDSFEGLCKLLEKYGAFVASARSGDLDAGLIGEIDSEIKDLDLEFLLEEVPNAIAQSLGGVSMIAKIVQSMKEFAHPGSSDKQAADLNRAIESTLTVAHNEWKYVADMETNFDPDLPLVPCYLGEFNQVILNMIINAAHAITDVVGDGGKGKGKITITTTKVNDWAEIRIGDTGGGVPPEAQPRIFDPFFTTKEVGRGTGQGLAISHTVVVDKHHGELSFTTEQGHGTTFTIRLPLSEQR